MSTSCVRHAAHGKFFVLHDDLLEIGRRFCLRKAHQFASSLRVLETWTNDRIKQTGSTEDLWIDVTWSAFAARSLWLFSERSFRSILPEVIKAGLARQRYIRRDQNGQIMAVYQTYKQALSDREYCGEIIHQVLFVSEAVNMLLEEEEEEGAQRSLPAGQPSRKSLGSARGGNPGTDQEINQNISSHRQNCQGGSTKVSPQAELPAPMGRTASPHGQNCQPPPGNFASNKSNNKNQRLLVESRNSAHSAIKLTLSQFDFSQEPSPATILQLSELLLPPCSANEETLSRIYDAAVSIASLPLVRARGLRHVAREMAYRAEEDSPCTWRTHCRTANPGFIVRLWHLASEPGAWKCAQEMDRLDWWPEYLQPALLGESPPDIDLAELAGIELHNRFGMNLSTTCEIEAYLADLLTPHGYEVRRRRVGVSRACERGFAIEVCFDHGGGTRRLRFYTPEQWDLIVQADERAPLGSPDFIRALTEAIRGRPEDRAAI